MFWTAIQENGTPQMPDLSGEEVADSGEVGLKFVEMAIKGGWIMIPLLILLSIGVYIFIERYFAIKRVSKPDSSFMNRIKDLIYDGKIPDAIKLCQSTNTPISRMIEKGVTRLGRPLNDVNVTIENMGNIEVSKLERGLPMLATISGGAPMIGFLGTVIGMIRAFYDMANAGNNIDVSLLSSGIYTAMVTTVAGLIVGIMAFFAYNYLVSRVENVVRNMEADTMVFLDLLNEPAN